MQGCKVDLGLLKVSRQKEEGIFFIFKSVLTASTAFQKFSHGSLQAVQLRLENLGLCKPLKDANFPVSKIAFS